MVEVPTWILALIGLALVIVIRIETIEYRRFVNAAKANDALAAGMKISYEQLTGLVNSMIDSINDLLKSDKSQDMQIGALGLLVDTHTDVLTMKMIANLMESMDKDEVGAKKEHAGKIQGA